MSFLSDVLPKGKLSNSANRRFIAAMVVALLVLLQLGQVAPFAVADAPPLAGGTPDNSREYVAFKDDTSPGFDNTLWIQDVTECKGDPAECSKNLGASKSFQVAYCLNKGNQMPYNMKEHDIKFDPNTGLVKNAQKYWRYDPSDRLIRSYVKQNTATDADLRAIKKVLYYGYHDADDSKWQKDNNISDLEFREGTQYALWHYTDNLDPYSGKPDPETGAMWTWTNGNVKKVYDYLTERDGALQDAPVDFKVNYFHNEEPASDSHYKKYQDLVSVRTIATPEEPTPNRPEPKRTKVLFKKVDQANAPLAGVKIRVYAKSKLADDGSILFDKTLTLSNDDKAVLDNLETDLTYYIEEVEVPGGYTKRNFEMKVDKNGNITFAGNNAPYGAVVPGKPDASGVITENTVTLKNEIEAPDGSAAKLGTTVHAGDVSASSTAPASVSEGTVKVTDTVKYEGFVADTYTFTGRLMKVENGKAVEPEVKKVTKDVTLAPGQDVGTVDMEFGDIKLEPGATYVVFETAESHNKVIKPAGSAEKTKLVVKHENADDKAQTIVVKKDGEMTLKTTVEVGGNKATADSKLTKRYTADELAQGITIRDNVNYTGLDTAAEYKLVGVLNKVNDDGTVTPITTAVTSNFKPNTQNLMFVDFSSVKGLEHNVNYVVYEYLFKAGDTLVTKTGNKDIAAADKQAARAKHEDPKDNAQTVFFTTPEKPGEPEPPAPTPDPKGELKTTVSVNGKAASAAAPVEVDAADKATVVDTIDYTGLVKGKEYTFAGRLMLVEDGKAPVEVAKSETKQTVAEADGSVKVEFKDVKLEAGKKYVVFETATSTEKLVEKNTKPHVVEHKDPSDKSQTVVVKKPSGPKPPAPNVPGKPGEPGPKPPAPNVPGKPGEPGPKPPAPNVPGKPNMAETGVASTSSLIGALGCLVSGALVLLYRRRRFK